VNQNVLPALARLAVHADLAAHQADQPLRDRESEAGPALASRVVRMRLDEGVEDGGLMLVGNPDAGVSHGAADESEVAVGRLEANLDLALLRELERVAREIDEDLAETARIASEECRQARIDEAVSSG